MASVFIFVLKRKKISFIITLNLVLSFLINNILLKFIFQRERPIDSLITETGYSFPSGHSFVAITFYGLLIYLIINSKWKNNIKIILVSLLGLIILMIGISRIYLGVHYPTDVVAGFVAGVIYLMIFININKRKGVDFNEKKQEK